MEMSFVAIKARIGEDDSDRRRLSRLPVELEAKMRELGASGVEAKVLNISESGFMAISEGRFEVGSRVWLMLPGRERANAVVKWTAGDKIGAEFAEPISIDGLDGITPRLIGGEPPLVASLPLMRHSTPSSRATERRAGRWAARKEVCHAELLERSLEALSSGAITPSIASMKPIIARGAGALTG